MKEEIHDKRKGNREILVSLELYDFSCHCPVLGIVPTCVWVCYLLYLCRLEQQVKSCWDSENPFWH